MAMEFDLIPPGTLLQENGHGEAVDICASSTRTFYCTMLIREQIEQRPTAQAYVGAGLNLARLQDYDGAELPVRAARNPVHHLEGDLRRSAQPGMCVEIQVSTVKRASGIIGLFHRNTPSRAHRR